MIKKYQLGSFIDYIKHPIQHTTSWSEGVWPTKKDYKNTIYINKNKQRLHYYDADGNLVINSPVSTGARSGNKQEEGDLRTPEGTFRISYSTDNADKNRFGDTLFYGLSYGHGIGIHGDANQPSKLGRPASHGCIRMPNGKLRCLQSKIGSGAGTTVIIEKLGGRIRRAQEGTKATFGQKVGNFLNSDGGQFAINGLTNLMQLSAQNKQVSSNADIAKAGVEQNESQQILEAANKAKQKVAEWLSANTDPNNPNANAGSIVESSKFNEFFNQELVAIKENSKNQKAMIDAQVSQQKSNNWGNAFGTIVQQGLGTLSNYLANKPKTTSTTTNTDNASLGLKFDSNFNVYGKLGSL